MRTIRVFVSSPGDVQKERKLADNLIRSVAGEFGIPVSVTYSNLLRNDDVSSAAIKAMTASWSFARISGNTSVSDRMKVTKNKFLTPPNSIW